MTDWTPDELDRIGAAEELELASRRTDGTLRPFVTMWVARVGDGLYVRSAYGPEAGWYRRAVASGEGRIRAGGVERDVRFEDASADVHRDLDAAYRTKYARFAENIVATVVGEHRDDVTLRLDAAG